MPKETIFISSVQREFCLLANDYDTAHDTVHEAAHDTDHDTGQWLSRFEEHNLSDGQKQALIFVREVGAIDNATYRQMSNCDIIQASNELRQLKKLELFKSKGKGKGTYYVSGDKLSTPADGLFTVVNDLITPAQGLSIPVHTESEPVHEAIVNQLPEESEPVRDALVNQLPIHLKEKLNKFTGRTTDKEALEIFICELCDFKDYSTKQLSVLFTKQEKYMLHNFIKPLRESGRLEYTIPEMPNHPQQAYKTKL